ncbi:hypothetical protein GCM10010174_69350 [Kutzneria viridogrisea]|uniref:SalK n=2 Tax=Kutzneria TaxID=43356 RepID=W5WJR5_9PSEU|nr:hypothetical protein [Kutzneria albida]AHH98409.1 hypothetical protein KALB_5047 [Kutzneria albida DSM 43870]MBA8924071.1 hypothetical protein [Kutzneria viridogrisea]
MTNPSPTLARRLWEAVEPIHAVAYFAAEPAAAAKAIGLPSWWMGYFTGRVAPLGALGPAAATAVVFGFAPGMVARFLPAAWTFTTPETALDARIDSVGATLRRTLPPSTDLDRLAELLDRAVRGCGFAGRPLAAAWSAVRPPEDALSRIWLAATVLREHRGDGHVLAAVHAGLAGIDATLTHVATGAVTRELLQINRGWTDEDWEQSRRGLVARGLLDRTNRLTKTGGALRRQIEEDTDRLAAGPVAALGESGVHEVIQLATPLSRHLVDSGVVPVPNPIGAPRP